MKNECVFPMLLEKDKKLPFYIIGIGCDEYQRHIVRDEGLPYHQIAFCINGSGTFRIDNHEFTIEKGTAFYFGPNTPHQYYPVNEPWTTLWIVFNGFGVSSLLDAMNYKQYEICIMNNLDEINIWYNRLFNTISLKDNNYMPEASAILYNVLINVGRQLTTKNIDNMSNITNKLDKVIDYIKENYSMDITLKDMAVVAGVSPSYLCRIFKAAFNLTPISYVIRYRINTAKESIINNPDKSIKSIACETGFSDCSYFGALFREYEGCSPNQFRMLYSRLQTIPTI